MHQIKNYSPKSISNRSILFIAVTNDDESKYYVVNAWAKEWVLKRLWGAYSTQSLYRFSTRCVKADIVSVSSLRRVCCRSNRSLLLMVIESTSKVVGRGLLLELLFVVIVVMIAHDNLRIEQGDHVQLCI
ncbi:unnamed protein product [Ranitomeya imitator]|uniref:Uncharacterized protein n=1 Tax=Ranitomeya imitator TaxID=111125 RepID=A0ABN9M2D6_9NEOB|nr:unnamed protein product [Ranitomeya imitator]